MTADRGARAARPGGAAFPVPTPGPSRRLVFLHPGQIFASREPCAVSTVLGSCVSVCLWDRELRVGGLNHFVLPFYSANERGEAKFSNVAVQRLVSDLRALGAVTARLEAKLFGGACVLASLKKTGGLGLQNVDAARRLLQEAGIGVVAEDVGGERGRRLVYHTDEGVAFVRVL